MAFYRFRRNRCDNILAPALVPRGSDLLVQPLDVTLAQAIDHIIRIVVRIAQSAQRLPAKRQRGEPTLPQDRVVRHTFTGKPHRKDFGEFHLP